MIEKILSKHDVSYHNRQLLIDGIAHSRKDFNALTVFKNSLESDDLIAAATDATLYDTLLMKGREKRDADQVVESKLGQADQEEIDQSNQRLQDCYLVNDVLSGDTIVVDKATGRKSKIPFDSIKTKLPKADLTSALEDAPYRAAIYSVEDVKEPVTIAMPGGPELFLPVNTYVPPLWQFEEDRHEDLHNDHKMILEKRFVGDSFERYCYFLYYLITTRNKNITGVIHESQGTGKSTAFNFIPSKLVGHENAHVARPDFLYKRFRDPLTRCRALIFEEFKLHENNVPDLKALTEPYISVEGKNKAERTIDNTFSISFTTNNYDFIYVEPGDRRWNILEDSGFHILNEYGPSFIKDYRERMETDSSFVANLGYWILNNFNDGKIKPDDTYRGPSFERACLETMSYKDETVGSAIEAFIFNDGALNEADELSSCEADYITYSDLKRIHNKKNRAATAGTNKRGSRFISLTDFESFFRQFRWKGREICQVERQEREVILRRLS